MKRKADEYQYEAVERINTILRYAFNVGGFFTHFAEYNQEGNDITITIKVTHFRPDVSFDMQTFWDRHIERRVIAVIPFCEGGDFENPSVKRLSGDSFAVSWTRISGKEK